MNGHAHTTAASRTSAQSLGRLVIALALTAVFVVVEAVTSFLVGSVALLSDAAHLLMDAVGIALAVGAVILARRAPAGASTYGLYRLEILASLANGLLLLLVAGSVLAVAVVRAAGHPMHVTAGPMLAVAVAGLAVNLVVFSLLRHGAQDSLVVRAPVVDALADAVGSAGVVGAAIVIATTGWSSIDAIVAIAVALLIIPRALRVVIAALRVLLEVAPAHVDLASLRDELRSLPGVIDVHDVHVWTLTSEMEVASAHVMVGAGIEPHAVLDAAGSLLRDRHAIAHATIQVEPCDHHGCAELTW
jgi:cobalt-zinc-cadmium efflux system protein